MVTTTVPISDVMQSLTGPEAAAIRKEEAPIEDPFLADAEEEEIAQLWARDPGNQGA